MRSHTAVAAETDAHFAAYRFDLAAQALYDFTWNAFCDWFVELAKPALNGTDAAAAASTRRTLLSALEALLRLLHPLIPFVTEELWQHVAPRLGIAGDSISLRPYPVANDFAAEGYADAAADIEWLKAVVTAVRSIRSQLGISPARQVVLLVRSSDAADAARVQRHGDALAFLLRLERIEPITGEPPAAAPAVVGGLHLFVPLAGLVDLDAERARLDKELLRVSGERDKSAAKLDKFGGNVPAAVIEQERQRLADWTAKLAALTEQRARLDG